MIEFIFSIIILSFLALVLVSFVVGISNMLRNKTFDGKNLE